MDDLESKGRLSQADAWEAIDVLNRQFIQYERTITALEGGPQSKIGRALLPKGSSRERFFLSVMKKMGRGGLTDAADESSPDPSRTPEERIAFIRSVLQQATTALPIAEQYLASLEYAGTGATNRGPNFVEDGWTIGNAELPVKLIAFYLPQFHPIPENDSEWGRGFTEWANVTRAIPQYLGQYQPHLPIDVGFYDLRVREVQERQVQLAKQYGLGGFAFYYYWFAGKRLLDAPLDSYVENSNIEFPFCLLWANENWTRRWDGHEDDVFVAQVHTPEADFQFIKDAEKYLRRPNYIRVEGKPLLIVYKVGLLPDPAETANRWRECARSLGIGELYLVAAQTMGVTDATAIGFDAAMQFPPHENMGPDVRMDYWTGVGPQILNPGYKGDICSYPALAKKNLDETEAASDLVYETAAPMWDNAARRLGDGWSYAYSSPELYRLWLSHLCGRAAQRKDPSKRLVFLNAWNEWAEGAHLEPDRRYGYAYLKATGEAVSPSIAAAKPDEDLRALLATPKTIVLLHDMGVSASPYVASNLTDDAGKHALRSRYLNDFDSVERAGRQQMPDASGLLGEVQRGRDIRGYLSSKGVRAEVICLVQEPVGRNVETFLREIEQWIPHASARLAARDLYADELHEVFLRLFWHDTPESWFQTQVQPVFGVDVYAESFAVSKSVEIVGGTFGVLRTEGMGDASHPRLQEALRKYSNDVPWEERTPFHELFSQRRLPAAYVDAMYSSNFARRFYSNEELTKFREKWVS